MTTAIELLNICEALEPVNEDCPYHKGLKESYEKEYGESASYNWESYDESGFKSHMSEMKGGDKMYEKWMNESCPECGADKPADCKC